MIALAEKNGNEKIIHQLCACHGWMDSEGQKKWKACFATGVFGGLCQMSFKRNTSSGMRLRRERMAKGPNAVEPQPTSAVND